MYALCSGRFYGVEQLNGYLVPYYQFASPAILLTINL